MFLLQYWQSSVREFKFFDTIPEVKQFIINNPSISDYITYQTTMISLDDFSRNQSSIDILKSTLSLNFPSLRRVK